MPEPEPEPHDWDDEPTRLDVPLTMAELVISEGNDDDDEGHQIAPRAA